MVDSRGGDDAVEDSGVGIALFIGVPPFERKELHINLNTQHKQSAVGRYRSLVCSPITQIHRCSSRWHVHQPVSLSVAMRTLRAVPAPRTLSHNSRMDSSVTWKSGGQEGWSEIVAVE